MNTVRLVARKLSLWMPARRCVLSLLQWARFSRRHSDLCLLAVCMWIPVHDDPTTVVPTLRFSKRSSGVQLFGCVWPNFFSFFPHFQLSTVRFNFPNVRTWFISLFLAVGLLLLSRINTNSSIWASLKSCRRAPSQTHSVCRAKRTVPQVRF